MNTNVIIPGSISIPIGRNGVLTALGGGRCSSLVLMARAEELFVLAMYSHHIKFADKVITSFIDSKEDEGLIIVECSVRKEIRNPRKLMRSVRNKLMGAAHAAKLEEEQDAIERIEWNSHKNDHLYGM